jgi:predicted Zn-dependent protease
MSAEEGCALYQRTPQDHPVSTAGSNSATRHSSTSGRAQRAEDVLAELASRQPKNLMVLSALAEIKLLHQDWTRAQKEQQVRYEASAIATASPIEILGAALSGH